LLVQDLGHSDRLQSTFLASIDFASSTTHTHERVSALSVRSQGDTSDLCPLFHATVEEQVRIVCYVSRVGRMSANNAQYHGMSASSDKKAFVDDQEDDLPNAQSGSMVICNEMCLYCFDVLIAFLNSSNKPIQPYFEDDSLYDSPLPFTFAPSPNDLVFPPFN
jgi:hypothetical protein